MKTSRRILVAGIGNIFLGDDAFGSEVAQRLLRVVHPPGVRVIDFGIRGLDLMYALTDGYDAALLIDAVPRGESPGTLFLLEPQIDAQNEGESSSPLLDGHSMDPQKVLRAAASMGKLPDALYILGCEPSSMSTGELADDQEMPMEMSPPVFAAVDEAVSMVSEILRRLLSDRSDMLTKTSPQAPQSAAANS